jgi:hypothetical protein
VSRLVVDHQRADLKHRTRSSHQRQTSPPSPHSQFFPELLNGLDQGGLDAFTDRKHDDGGVSEPDRNGHPNGGNPASPVSQRTTPWCFDSQASASSGATLSVTSCAGR